MDTNDIQIGLEIIIGIIALYLAFFKSYFQEKGKNLATKEDIEDITKVVEKIKNQLHFSTQTKLNLKLEEKSALVNLYEKYNYWLTTIMDVYFGGINDKNIYKLREIESKIGEAKFGYEMAEGRVGLFVDNEILSKIRFLVKFKTLELQNLTIKKIVELESLLTKMSIIQSYPQNEEFLIRFQNNMDEQVELTKKLNEEKLEKFKEIVSIDKEFRTLIYKLVQEIIEQ